MNASACSSGVECVTNGRQNDWGLGKTYLDLVLPQSEDLFSFPSARNKMKIHLKK